MSIHLDPVAYFHAEAKEKADLPRQASLALGNRGYLSFVSGKNFEQALQDLEGTSRIWVLFWMDKALHFKAKVQPPRIVGKKGVFSTRSPHRPNPIGLSCVRLISVSGLLVTIEDHDLLDGSPILDIKPYLPYADSFPDAEIGWMKSLSSLQANKITWSMLAVKQATYIDESRALQVAIEERLRFFSEPTSSNRITLLENSFYLQAYKSWRFVLHKVSQYEIQVLAIFSGNTRKEEQSLESASLQRQFYAEFSKEMMAFISQGSLLSRLEKKVCLEF